MRYVVAVFFLIAFASSAFAAPPPGADPDSTEGLWFRSLTQPQTGGSCCGSADCRHYPVSSAMGDDGTPHYTVLFDGAWLPVPKEAILERIDNPTGAVVTCVGMHYQDVEAKPDVICLIRAVGT